MISLQNADLRAFVFLHYVDDQVTLIKSTGGAAPVAVDAEEEKRMVYIFVLFLFFC